LAFLLGIKLMPCIRNSKDLKWFRQSADEVYKHIDDLFTKDAIGWDLIACHLPDMLQVAQSIRAGRIQPSIILRKLGTASRKNKMYFAFRELGRSSAPYSCWNISATMRCARSSRPRKTSGKGSTT
jgi:TnpA family transposase